MAESSLLKVISQKIIKPSSPTPPSLRYYKLSSFDANMADITAATAMFYPSRSFHGVNLSKIEEQFEVVEIALSKALTYYYPFAGKLMDDNITVDCNDVGAQVWRVQFRCKMSELLNNRTDYHPWNSVYRDEMYECVTSNVMIQLGYFECGGISIICSASHKLGDAMCICKFMDDWAAIARGLEDVRPPNPVFSGASIFPPPNKPFTFPVYKSNNNDVVTQRFVFSASNISELKKKIMSETKIENPTQNEVITALIFKSIVSTTTKLNALGSFEPSSLLQILNFRTLTIPPLSENIVGNFVDKLLLTVTEEKDITFSKLVTELRKCKLEYIDSRTARLEGNEFMNRFHTHWIEDYEKFKNNISDLYVFTSVFRLPFYEVDFGFGKPIFVCIPGGKVEKVIILMGTPNGDGINAFVTLKRDQMSIFEQDEELLAFASLNPIICTSN